MNTKYLITGGRGFIGKVLVQKTGGYSYDLRDGQDIFDARLLEDSLKGVRGVFHCAAKISVPESIKNAPEYFRVNVEGTGKLIGACEDAHVNIVFSSSAAVYGESSEHVREDAITNPKSPYAENKRDAENLLARSRISAIALRYFNVYGPGQSDAYAGVISAFIRRALTGDDIVIYGDGSQTRDFIFVDDVATANIAAMEYIEKNTEKIFDTFNIATGQSISVLDVAKKVVGLTSSSSKISFGREREGDIVHSRADVTKAQNILGWKASVSFDEGLLKTIEYYKNL